MASNNQEFLDIISAPAVDIHPVSNWTAEERVQVFGTDPERVFTGEVAEAPAVKVLRPPLLQRLANMLLKEQ